MNPNVAEMMPVFILAGLAGLLLVVMILGSLFRIRAFRYRMTSFITHNPPRWLVKFASLSRGTAPMVSGAVERKNEKVRELEPQRVSYDEHAAEDEDGDPDDGDAYA